MLKIRVFEQRAVELFTECGLPGWIHSYIGAVSVLAIFCGFILVVFILA